MVAQREARDCTVACVAMVAGVDYDAALAALRHVGGRRYNKSYRLCYVERAAALLGRPLRRRRRGQYDPRLTAGVICMRGCRKSHVAVLWYGLLFDTDGQIWLLNDYLTHWAPYGRFCTLLEVEDARRDDYGAVGTHACAGFSIPKLGPSRSIEQTANG